MNNRDKFTDYEALSPLRSGRRRATVHWTVCAPCAGSEGHSEHLRDQQDYSLCAG